MEYDINKVKEEPDVLNGDQDLEEPYEVIDNVYKHYETKIEEIYVKPEPEDVTNAEEVNPLDVEEEIADYYENQIKIEDENESFDSKSLKRGNYSGSSSSDNDQEQTIVKKRVRILNEWIKVEEFESHAAAHQNVDNNIWFERTATETERGHKRYFRCKISSICPAQIYLFYCVNSTKVLLYSNEKNHDHTQIKQKRGISDNIKDIINTLFDDGIKTPSTIQSALRRQGLGDIPLLQLKNYLESLRVKKYIGQLEESTVKKRVRTLNEWVQVEEFENLDVAHQNVDNNIWFERTATATERGHKRYFRCKISKICPAQIHLFYCDNAKVILFSNEKKHDHTEKKQKRGIPENIKDIINNLFNDGIKTPSAIQSALRKQDLGDIPLLKLKNYLHSLRIKKHGNFEINLQQLEEWCRFNSIVPSEDEDKAFIAAYNILHNDETKFNFFITTKRLISLVKSDYPIHIDSTYKLIWQGFPVFIAGTSDKNHTFHPCGVMVSVSENSEDFKFLFNSVKDCVQKLCGLNWKPTVLVADASEAITNSFTSVFGSDFKRVMCWAHVKRAIDTRLLTVLDKNKRESLEEDIYTLHYSTSSAEFHAAFNLFKQKYQDEISEVTDFLHYFEEYWIVGNSGWYKGFALGIPSTNNALEATNSSIKRAYAFTKSLPMSEFFLITTNFVQDWSRQRFQKKLFALEPYFPDKMLRDAYHWVNSNPCVISEESNITNEIIYYIAPRSFIITKSTVDSFKSNSQVKNWNSFEEYRKHRMSIWVVCINKESWKEAHCTCITFMKDYMCKHTIGVAMVLKLFKGPVSVTQISFGEKRKRGRPQKAEKGLIPK